VATVVWRAEVEAHFAKQRRGQANDMKGMWGRERKETVVSKSRLTDEYIWARNGSPAPHIFVGGTTSRTNICHVYSSVTCLHRQIYGLVKVKPDSPYIRQCLVQTDEYDFIFVGFGTDKYNFNIFIGTDEF
jgi:hypothetical protein